MAVIIGRGPGAVDVGGLYAPLPRQLTAPTQPWVMWSASLASAAAMLVAGSASIPIDQTPPKTNYQALFGRVVAAPAGRTPWYLWNSVARTVEPEIQPPRVDLETIHRFRTRFQTVGQPRSAFYVQPRPPPDVEVASLPLDLTLLHRYRVGYQTVGQGYRLWPAPARPVIDPDVTAPTPISYAALYGRTKTVTVTVGAPWYLWAPLSRSVEPEPATPQTDHSRLHLYRVGFQTVGQPAWSLHWKPRAADPVELPEPRREPNLIHSYRVGYQTVGQPWQALWPQPRVQPVDVEVVAPLLPDQRAFYGRALLVPPTAGQPWYLWQASWLFNEPAVTWLAQDHSQLHLYRQLPPSIALSVPPTAGSVPGWVPGGKPFKRTGQVFGEDYPIASDVVHSDGTASLRDLAQSDLLGADSLHTQGPTGGAFGDIEGRVLDAVLTDSEKAALGLLWAMMLSLDS